MKRKLSNASSSRGAQMGRRNIIPDGMLSRFAKLHLVRLKWVDGDYDQGGAYWGGSVRVPDPRVKTVRGVYMALTYIYWAYNDEGIEIFVRAIDRPAAKSKVRELLPNARFFN
jgi:hypothetical protein